MTIDEQITHLNATVKCRIAPSKIHGIGVFAMRDIKPGEDLCVRRSDKPPEWYTIPLSRFDEIHPDIRALILDRWAQPKEGGKFQSPNDDQNLMSFVNHSSYPNSSQGVAIRRIIKGEEITESYDDLGAPLSDVSRQHYGFL